MPNRIQRITLEYIIHRAFMKSLLNFFDDYNHPASDAHCTLSDFNT